MTVKLPKDLTLTVEVYREDGQHFIFIEDDNSTGCEYEVTTIEDVAECIKDYIKNIGD